MKNKENRVQSATQGVGTSQHRGIPVPIMFIRTAEASPVGCQLLDFGDPACKHCLYGQRFRRTRQWWQTGWWGRVVPRFFHLQISSSFRIRVTVLAFIQSKIDSIGAVPAPRCQLYLSHFYSVSNVGQMETNLIDTGRHDIFFSKMYSCFPQLNDIHSRNHYFTRHRTPVNAKESKQRKVRQNARAIVHIFSATRKKMLN